MVKYKTLVGALAAVALTAAPLAPAEAHGRGGLFFGLFAAGAAVVGAAAIIATAPVRIVASAVEPVYVAPPPRPYAYYGQPAYYAPAPGYYYYGR